MTELLLKWSINSAINHYTIMMIVIRRNLFEFDFSSCFSFNALVTFADIVGNSFLFLFFCLFFFFFFLVFVLFVFSYTTWTLFRRSDRKLLYVNRNKV